MGKRRCYQEGDDKRQMQLRAPKKNDKAMNEDFLKPVKYHDNLRLPLYSRERSDMVAVADENNTRYVWTHE